jgi:DNA-binding transcriptional ArsR family regulator
MKQPTTSDADTDIQWLCQSLGLLGRRDKNKMSLKIFKAVLSESRKQKVVSAEDICRRIRLSRTAVMHHLSAMQHAGFVIRNGGGFELRTGSLQRLIDEIGLDIERALKSIREIAEDVDRRMEMPVRKKS